MRCDRAQELLGAYVDQELSNDEHTSVAAHIHSCVGCSESLGEIKDTSKAIAELGRRPAPRALAPAIRSRLAGAPVQELGGKRLPPWRISSSLWRQATALAACCVLSVALTWWVMTSTAQVNAVQQEIVVAHIRSLLQDSPIQVASSDSHTVKPWFAGRVDFAPEVNDLTAEGFPLLGGRLDYVNQRRVGTLVYRRRQHIVNVFMWGAPDTEDIAPTLATRNGYNLLVWTKGAVTYWAISDVAVDELKRLQRLL